MSTAAYVRRRLTTAERAGGRAHVIAHRREQIGHGLGVLARDSGSKSSWLRTSM
jgi:hypothetical protein